MRQTQPTSTIGGDERGHHMKINGPATPAVFADETEARPKYDEVMRWEWDSTMDPDTDGPYPSNGVQTHARADQRLVLLLADHAAKIDDLAIRVLADLPKRLRRPLPFAVSDWPRRLNGLTDGLRFLVCRGVVSNLDEVVAKLATMTAGSQLAAVVQFWVDSLPLPQMMPPATVGRARRLDRVDELTSLARAWSNCLGDYRSAIDAGSCAVYLWQDAEKPAACLVWRHGRLGWFLDEVKGPRNAAIEPEQRAIIDSAFAELGILRSRVALGIDNMICGDANLLFSVEEH
jgi:hypothetical protein